MYISLNNEYIYLNFNSHPFLKISGPDDLYHVELREYLKNDDKSISVENFKVAGKSGLGWRTDFECPIEFYGDWEISVSKFIPSYGLRKIFTHRFNDYGKWVKFNLDTNDREECELWVERIKVYQSIHGCEVILNSKFDEINKKYLGYYSSHGIDFYKTYNIGRFPKMSTDFRTLDKRKEGVIWFGNWKTFWSYQHPRPWKFLNSQEIVDDILGL
jgi:hypothetical protein